MLPILRTTFFIILLLTITCKKDDIAKVTKLEIGTTSNITETTATVSAEFIDVSTNITSFGFCWATTSKPEVTDGITPGTSTAKKGVFSLSLTGLSEKTKYYVRVYAMEGDKPKYSTEEISFTTLAAKYINITAPVATDNWTNGSAQNIKWTDNIDENVDIILMQGETIALTIADNTPNSGTYSWEIPTSLSNAVNYTIIVRSVSDASILAQSEAFEISETQVITITAPISTDNWQKGSTYNITWSDNIEENVKIELFKGGVYDSDIAANTDSDGTESWTIPTTFNADNNYTIKISSVDDESISDESENFTISVAQPTVITTDASSITGTTVTLNGTVNANGENVNVSFEWGETTAYGNTVTATPASVGGSTLTSVSANITGLTAGTTYHFNLKAGSEYGGDKDFITTTPSSPSVTTGLVSNVAYTTATCGGDVTDEGSEPVTAKGVCWSTDQYPTIGDNKTNDGTGAGVFSSDITELSENTTYYVRAYATNSIETSYGEQKELNTEKPPVVTTSSFTPDYISAIGGGTVTDVGSLGVSARGVCWSIDQNPTISDNITINGSGIGGFSSSLINLQLGITYYVRAYASNTLRTEYGNQISFTTLTTITYNGITYDVVLIGNHVWFAENLRTTHFNDGNPIQQVGDNTSWTNMTTPAYCWYDNDFSNVAIYGVLYNWFAANSGKLCPTDWHVPTDDDWSIIGDYMIANNYNFDGTTTGNKIAKSMTSTSLWYSTDIEGAPGNTDYSSYRNMSGFNAVPGGTRLSVDGQFYHLGVYANWHSGNLYGENTISVQIGFNSVGLNSFISYASSFSTGKSIRCLKD